jgi:hydrogenase-4 component F
LLGFGAVAGLVAPWSWLPGVGIARPAPAVPLVQVGLPVCALQAILRWAVLARHALGSAFPTHLLLATGLLGLVALLPALLVERDTRRMTALGGAAQVTMIAAAWGLNSQAAAGGGMLLLLCWSLAGSAALPVIASARDRQGGERFLRLGVLPARAPIPGAALLAALLTYGWWAPSGAFLALVAVLEAAMRQSIPIGLLLIVCAAVTMPALTRHATQLARGWRWRAPRRAGSAVARADQLAGSWPLLIPPAALLVLGVHVPDGLANLIVQAASTVGGGS